MTMVQMVLPMPPSINHYYGSGKNGIRYLKKPAKVFRHEVAVIAHKGSSRGVFGNARLAMRVDLHFGNGGDLDNRLKGLLDALEYAEVFENDRQIDDLRIVRGHRVVGGRCEVKIWEL